MSFQIQKTPYAIDHQAPREYDGKGDDAFRVCIHKDASNANRLKKKDLGYQNATPQRPASMKISTTFSHLWNYDMTELMRK